MGLVRPLVPVACVFRIAFPAMQVGVDPGRLLPGLLVLRNLVSAVKIPFGIPPKRFQQGRQARRRAPSRRESRNSSIVMAAFYADGKNSNSFNIVPAGQVNGIVIRGSGSYS